MKPGSYHVFISYSSLDDTIAREICAFLENEGLTCWLAARDNVFDAGKRYQEMILNALMASQIMVVVLTEHARDSKYVNIEIERAYHYDKPIIPFQIETLTYDPFIEFYFSTIQVLSAIESPVSKYFPTLYQSCKKLLNENSHIIKGAEHFKYPHPGTPIDQLNREEKNINDSKTDQEQDKENKNLIDAGDSTFQDLSSSFDKDKNTQNHFEADSYHKNNNSNEQKFHTEIDRQKSEELTYIQVHTPVERVLLDQDKYNGLNYIDSKKNKFYHKLNFRLKGRRLYPWFAGLIAVGIGCFSYFLINKENENKPQRERKVIPRLIKSIPKTDSSEFRSNMVLPVTKFDDTTLYDSFDREIDVNIQGSTFKVKVVSDKFDSKHRKLSDNIAILSFIFYKDNKVYTILKEVEKNDHETYITPKFFKIQRQLNDTTGNLYLSITDEMNNSNIYYIAYDGQTVKKHLITNVFSPMIEAVFSKDEKTLITATYCQYLYEQSPNTTAVVIGKFIMDKNGNYREASNLSSHKYSLNNSFYDRLLTIKKTEPRLLNGIALNSLNFKVSSDTLFRKQYN